MGSKRYGEEMSKIVRFTPKGQTTMDGIYGHNDKANERHSSISEQNTTREVFGQEKFYLRPSDEGYDEVREIAKPKKRKTKTRSQGGREELKNSKRAKPSIKKAPSSKIVKDPESSKVVAKERRRAVLDSIKPTREQKRVLFISIAMTAMLAMFISFFYVSSRISSVKYENLELKKQYENKQNEKKELETKMESNNRSEIIEKVAREQLGMSYPRPDQIVYIKSN